VEDTLQESRKLGLLVCTALDWDVSPEIKPIARRILRLIVVQYFVMTEFLGRTGPNKTTLPKVMDRMREDVRLITGPQEFDLLYPFEPRTTKGSQSVHSHANALKVTLWIQLMLMDAAKKKALVTQPSFNLLLDSNMRLYEAFWDLNLVDKNQFPLPYVQLVKLLLIVYVFSYPFVLEPSCQGLTPVAMAIIAIGFFGCEEVAGILESPFGTDANDIDLKDYGAGLIRDLEVLYYNRETKAEFVFDDEVDLDFADLMEGLGYNKPRSRSSMFGRVAKEATPETDGASHRKLPRRETGNAEVIVSEASGLFHSASSSSSACSLAILSGSVDTAPWPPRRKAAMSEEPPPPLPGQCAGLG